MFLNGAFTLGAATVTRISTQSNFFFFFSPPPRLYWLGMHLFKCVIRTTTTTIIVIIVVLLLLITILIILIIRRRNRISIAPIYQTRFKRTLILMGNQLKSALAHHFFFFFFKARD